jgi:hypothetical protein
MSFAIRAFVGPNGGGKTLAMIDRMVVEAWKVGRPVCANLELFPERLGFSPSLYVPLESWKQIPELEGVTLCLDEISSVLPSRQAMSVPPQLVRVLNQLRKGDVQLAWTAPNWSRCDVLLREVTQAVTVCRGSFPDKWQRMDSGPARWNRPVLQGITCACGPGGYVCTEHDAPDGQLPPTERPLRAKNGWGPNRYFVWRTYDAMEFDEFTYSAVKDVRPRAVQRFWRPRHSSDLAYNTLDAVGLLDHLDDVGLCVNCGGTRSRPRCSCDSAKRSAGRNAAGGAPVDTAAEPPGQLVDPRDPHGPVKPRQSRERRVRP